MNGSSGTKVGGWSLLAWGLALALSVGVYIVGIKDPGDASSVSQRIDANFHDSPAETRTETEKAFARMNEEIGNIRLTQPKLSEEGVYQTANAALFAVGAATSARAAIWA